MGRTTPRDHLSRTRANWRALGMRTAIFSHRARPRDTALASSSQALPLRVVQRCVALCPARVYQDLPHRRDHAPAIALVPIDPAVAVEGLHDLSRVHQLAAGKRNHEARSTAGHSSRLMRYARRPAVTIASSLSPPNIDKRGRGQVLYECPHKRKGTSPPKGPQGGRPQG